MKKIIVGLKSDLASSLVVFLVAIPLCLGIAVASGVSEFSGIIAGIIGGVVVGGISGSSLSVSGPAAGLTAIVSAAVLKLPAVEALFLAVVLAGVFQIIMGWGKLGAIGDYVPNSVIKGMLAAIGIILILKQAPHLVGYDKDFEGDETFIQMSGENSFSSMINSLNHLTPISVTIGFLGLLILMAYELPFIKKWSVFQIISGPLMVVITGAMLNSVLSDSNSIIAIKEAHMVNIPVAKNAMEFQSFFKFPNWGYLSNADVWITAFTLAIVASLETLLSIEAVDKLDPLKRVSPPNRELIAQGTGNMISGFLGGLPLTSVIVRSSANVNAGAKTKLSTFLHGILILLSVAFFPEWLNLIPKSALAAVLIFTGYKLAKPSLFKEHYNKGWDQFAPFITTIVCIVLTDLLKGVLVGMGVGLFYVIRNNFRSAVFTINEKDNYMIRLRKDVSFFIKPILKNKLEQIPNNTNLIIDIFHAEHIDRDVIDTINEFLKHATIKNINCSIKTNPHNSQHQLIEQN
jgi:MFS superfamily sulfate permease-like transporter